MLTNPNKRRGAKPQYPPNRKLRTFWLEDETWNLFKQTLKEKSAVRVITDLILEHINKNISEEKE